MVWVVRAWHVSALSGSRRTRFGKSVVRRGGRGSAERTRHDSRQGCSHGRTLYLCAFRGRRAGDKALAPGIVCDKRRNSRFHAVKDRGKNVGKRGRQCAAVVWADVALRATIAHFSCP